MLRITCPFCGPRDHSEFSYEGDATVDWPALDASEDAWFDAVFLREIPGGRTWSFGSMCAAAGRSSWSSATR